MTDPGLPVKRIIFGGSSLDICYQGTAADRVIEFLTRHIPAITDDPYLNEHPADFSYTLKSSADRSGMDLFAGDEIELAGIETSDMALYLAGQMCFQIAYFSSSGLMIHAGAASSSGRAILLPGITGKGKTSLTAYLLHQDWDYLTDEMVFLPEASLTGLGFARPLNFKRTAAGLLESFLGGAGDDENMLRTALVDLVQPETFGCGDVAGFAEIVSVVFPVYHAGAEFSLRPLSKAQTGLRLMQCLINARNLPEHGFPEVSAVSRQIPAFELVYSHFDQIGDRLEKLI